MSFVSFVSFRKTDNISKIDEKCFHLFLDPKPPRDEKKRKINENFSVALINKIHKILEIFRS